MRQLKISKSITNRETASLDKYLSDVAREELITADEEVLLAQRIKQGDQVALEKLVKANLRFVVSVAKQYQNQGFSLPDLINEGNLGLIKAAQRFDETRGFKFISYAVWWIRQAILKALADYSRIVRIPFNRIGSISKVNKAYAILEQQYERKPSADEIALLLELSEKEVEEAMRNSSSYHLSLDAPIDEGQGIGLINTFQSKEFPETDEILIKQSLKEEIQRSLSRLTEKERDIINLFYGLLNGGYYISLEEIGERYDLTRERVRQIKEKAIRRLKHTSRSKILKSYLG